MVDDHEHLEHDPVYAGKYTDARTKVRGNVIYGEYMSKRMIDGIPGSLRGRALDLMCGSGAMFSAIASEFEDFVGVDSSPAMLDLVSKQFQANTVLADATDLPKDIGSFDVVFIRGGLHHVPDGIGTVIAEATRVLRPKGRIVMWELCADFMPVRKLRERVYKQSEFFDSDHERGLYAFEIENELRKAGYTDVESSHVGNLGYLLLFNSDASPVAKLVGSLPFPRMISQIVITGERIWESIPLLNKAAFNLLVKATAPSSDNASTD
jgi:SAM-dependent methyltransferase